MMQNLPKEVIFFEDIILQKLGTRALALCGHQPGFIWFFFYFTLFCLFLNSTLGIALRDSFIIFYINLRPTCILSVLLPGF